MQNWQKLRNGKKECSFSQGKIFQTTTGSLARADSVIAARKVPTDTELLLPGELSTHCKHKCGGQGRTARVSKAMAPPRKME